MTLFGFRPGRRIRLSSLGQRTPLGPRSVPITGLASISMDAENGGDRAGDTSPNPRQLAVIDNQVLALSSSESRVLQKLYKLSQTGCEPNISMPACVIAAARKPSSVLALRNVDSAL